MFRVEAARRAGKQATIKASLMRGFVLQKAGPYACQVGGSYAIQLRFKECDGRYHMTGRSPTWHEKKDSPLVGYHSIGGRLW